MADTSGEKGFSQSPNLTECSSFTATSMVAGIHLHEISESLQVSHSEGSNLLTSSSNSGTSTINGSDCADNSLCATPNKAQVNAASAFVRKRRFNNECVEFAERFSEALNSSNNTLGTDDSCIVVKRKSSRGFVGPKRVKPLNSANRPMKEANFLAALMSSDESDDSVISALKVKSKSSAFCNRKRRADPSNNKYLDVLHSSVDESVTGSNKRVSAFCRKKLGNRAANLAGNFIDAFDSSGGSVLESAKENADPVAVDKNLADVSKVQNTDSQNKDISKNNSEKSCLGTDNHSLVLSTNKSSHSKDNESGEVEIVITVNNEGIETNDQTINKENLYNDNANTENSRDGDKHTESSLLGLSQKGNNEKHEKSNLLKTFTDPILADDVMRNSASRRSLMVILPDKNREINSDISNNSRSLVQRSLMSQDNVSNNLSGKKFDNTFSQSNAVLHIESDFDSMACSSESDDDSDGKSLADDRDMSSKNFSKDKRSVSSDVSSKVLRSSDKSLPNGDSVKDIRKSNSTTEEKILSARETVQNASLASVANRNLDLDPSYNSMDITDSINLGVTVNNGSNKNTSSSNINVQTPGVLVNGKSPRVASLRKGNSRSGSSRSVQLSENSVAEQENKNLTNSNSGVPLELDVNNSKGSEVSQRLASLRRRNLAVSMEKSKDGSASLSNSATENSPSNSGKSRSSINKSKSRQQVKNKSNSNSSSGNKSRNKSKETPKHDSIERSSLDLSKIPFSELRGKCKPNETHILEDRDMINRALTFKRNTQINSKRSVTANDASDDSRTTLKPNKTPKLIKPKRWVTRHLYSFIIKKLEPRYDLKSRYRAEKFVIYLCNSFDNVVSVAVTENTAYKKIVDNLITEMARLQIIVSHWDFYSFVETYLPHSFFIRSVPTVMPFNEEPYVIAPENEYSSIL